MEALYDHSFSVLPVITPGSSTVSMAYNLSALCRNLEERSCLLPNKWWIAVDAANIFSNLVPTPSPGKCLLTAKERFSYWLPSERIKIQQTFVVIVDGWRISWEALRVLIETSTQVVLVCFKLRLINLADSGFARVPQYGLSNVLRCFMDCSLQNVCTYMQAGRRDKEVSNTLDAFPKKNWRFWAKKTFVAMSFWTTY